MIGKKLYMGIDGGGTRTTVLVTDEEGRAICRERGANINYYASGMKSARENLQAVLRRVYTRADRENVAAVFIGMSAIEYEADPKLINEYAGDMFECPVFMHTDAYVALMGFTLGKAGALTISGTGSISIGMNATGQLKVFGGWGYLLGDEGSAYHIAMSALRSAVKMFDHIERPTLLCDAVMEWFGLKEPGELLKCCAPGMPRQRVAAFAKGVAACARKGDGVARDILLNAAEDLAKLAAAAAKYAQCTEVGIYGGVLQNNEIVREQFRLCLRQYIPGGTAVLPQLPPEAGAVIAAMTRDGIQVDHQVVESLKDTINEL